MYEETHFVAGHPAGSTSVVCLLHIRPGADPTSYEGWESIVLRLMGE